MILVACVSFIVIGLDQYSKYLFSANMALGESFPVIENVFHFTLIHNRGVAFGLFNDTPYIPYILILVGISVMYFVIQSIRRLDMWQKVAAGMIIGGAIGNIIDRIRIGAVIDFLDFRIWPIFNVADSAISIAAGIFIIHILFTKNETL
jgi:signal peptidase II